MIDIQDIKVTKATESKLKSVDFNNLPFGRTFTDHMLIADYKDGEWGNVEIKPYQPIAFDPSLAALQRPELYCSSWQTEADGNDRMR